MTDRETVRQTLCELLDRLTGGHGQAVAPPGCSQQCHFPMDHRSEKSYCRAVPPWVGALHDIGEAQAIGRQARFARQPQGQEILGLHAGASAARTGHEETSGMVTMKRAVDRMARRRRPSRGGTAPSGADYGVAGGST